MSSMLHIKKWSAVTRTALTATQIIAKLAHLDGWKLCGGDIETQLVSIEKTYQFANYFETICQCITTDAWCVLIRMMWVVSLKPISIVRPR